MPNTLDDNNLKHNATVFLVSGELDKAVAAFDVAIGFAAMGVKVDMWFIFYGINSIKKPLNFSGRLKYLYKKISAAPGRQPESDLHVQRLIPFLNSAHSQSLPLSCLNFFGAGPLLIKFVMRHKGSPQLQELVEEARDLGVNFKICQPCIDILMLDVEQDLLVKAQVAGVSSYAVDVMKSHYNAVF